MPKRLIPAKTSDSRMVGLAGLARWLGKSQRTVREYCKRGLIPEAVRTPGGHWRLRLPLSAKTKFKLAKLKDPSLKKRKLGIPTGNFDLEFTEWRLLARIYSLNVFGDEVSPAPSLYDLTDPLFQSQENVKGQEEGVTKWLIGGKDDEEISARLMQRQLVIIAATKGAARRRLLLQDLLLRGVIYECWCEDKRRLPMATTVIRRLGISRYAFYHHYPRKTFKKIRGQTLANFIGDVPVREKNPKKRTFTRSV
jgi:hypothetical protein